MTAQNQSNPKHIFDFKEEDFDKDQVVALKIMQNPEALKALIIKANAFPLLEYISDTSPDIIKVYIESKREEFEIDAASDPLLQQVANRTKNPAATLKILTVDTVEKNMSDFMLTLSPKYKSYLKPKKVVRKNKEKEDFIVLTIDGQQHGFAGGAHVKPEIVEYLFNKVKHVKPFEDKVKALFKEVDKVKVMPFATPTKVKSLVYSVLSIKTTRFKVGELETNCRGVILKELTENIIAEMAKNPKLKLVDFYIENDFDKAFPDAKKKAFEGVENDIKKRKLETNVENF